jgi:hypothetical protein
MRSLPYLSIAAFALFVAGTDRALAAETASAAVAVSAQFASRTSLTVSTERLQFDVAQPDQPALAAVDFTAAARTQAGAEIVLSVEPLRPNDGPGGAADVESSLTFAGEGNGTLAGTVATAGATPAGRWTGSGVRTGRLLFSLRAGAPGTYAVTLRFVLSAP